MVTKPVLKAVAATFVVRAAYLTDLSRRDHQPRMSITAALSQHACRTPDRIAVRCEDHQITWGALDRAVDRLATHLVEAVPTGSAVALHLPNGPALILLFLAAARAGREAQILDPDWPPAMVHRVIAALSPAMVVTARTDLSHARLIHVDPFGPFDGVAEAIGAGDRFTAAAAPDPLTSFYVGFTSGSTGMPKGYRRHHRSWLESFAAADLEFDIGPDDVVLAPGALTHSLFLYGLAHGLHVGASVVLCRRFRPNTANRVVPLHNVTVIYGVPTQLETMIDATARSGAPPFAGVRWVLSSGAKWKAGSTARLRRQFPAARFAEFYGSSELSFVTVTKDDENVPEDSVGRAFANVTISIRDHLGRKLGPGEAGLVFVESPFQFMEYACGDTGALPHAEKEMSVGDVGVLDARGFLRLVGRASRMIIVSGKNIHPEAIEQLLEHHPAIASAAVMGITDDRRGERLVALVRPREGAAPNRSALIAWARSALPLYKVPRRYAVPREWPLTRSGKTDFQALVEMWKAGAWDELP
jgi:long-chain acyl-CoA synthetase